MDDPRVTAVRTIGRRATGRSHPKLDEIIHEDFLDYSGITASLTGFERNCVPWLGIRRDQEGAR
jgi:hypothetical protein